MFGRKRYHYIVDGLTTETAALLKKSLAIVPQIRSAEVSASRGTVDVDARRDVADEVRVACGVAGVTFRTRMRR